MFYPTNNFKAGLQNNISWMGETSRCFQLNLWLKQGWLWGQTRLLRGFFSLNLKISGCTTSLGNLLHCLTVLISNCVFTTRCSSSIKLMPVGDPPPPPQKNPNKRKLSHPLKISYWMSFYVMLQWRMQESVLRISEVCLGFFVFLLVVFLVDLFVCDFGIFKNYFLFIFCFASCMFIWKSSIFPCSSNVW